MVGLTAQRRPLGDSGLTTTAVGLGTAALAVPYGAPQGERAAVAGADARAAIEHAIERGVRFIDTAPAYGDAEALVGAATAGAAADCVVATKIAIPAAGWHALGDGATRDHVRASVEASLLALRREVVDVLALHNAEPELLERGAVVAALVELRDEGMIRLAGASVYGERAALAAVQCDGLAVVQVAVSALDRSLEPRVLPAAAANGTALVARSALLRGVLTPAGARMAGPFAPLRAAADAFRTAAGADWEELPGAAIAFLLHRPALACVLLGPRDAAELDDLLDGAARFVEPTRDLDANWSAGVPAELLDPRCWPSLEGAA